MRYTCIIDFQILSGSWTEDTVHARFLKIALVYLDERSDETNMQSDRVNVPSALVIIYCNNSG